MRLFFLVGLLLLMTSCARLSVRTEKLDQRHLASYHVATPDPTRCQFFKGQQVVVSWYYCQESAPLPFLLRLFLIRANHTQEIWERKLTTKRGSTIFYFLGEDWCSKGEILTWRAELYSGGRLIACHAQKPWVDWIDEKD